MALSSKKTRKTRNRAAAVSIDTRIAGTEPLTVTEENYTKALNWYNYMHDIDEAKAFLLDYLKSKRVAKETISFVRRCPKDMFITTIGWQARMMMNGNTLPPRSQKYFKETLTRVADFGRAAKEEVVTVKVEKPSIQERTAAKNRQVWAQCEIECIDERKSIYSFLQKHEVTPSAATFIRSRCELFYNEVMEDSADIKEAFGKKLKAERKYWQEVIDDLDRYVGNKKAVKVRKPRAKKVKAAIDVVKNMKYQKEDASLKIVSVNPAEIIGAQQLWVYNTKYKKLTVFNAQGPAGFNVKGTTLQGFDANTSISKRLRKPEVSIKELLGAGKIALRKFMDKLTTNPSAPTGRINSDTVLLKVVK